MSVLDPQDLIDDIAVVREQDEARRILVETPDRENSIGMADFSNDVSSNMQLSGGRHPNRLVILEIHRTMAALEHNPVARYEILRGDLIAELGHQAIDGYPPGSDQAIGLPTRSQALLGKKFINAHGREMNSRESFLVKSAGSTASPQNTG